MKINELDNDSSARIFTETLQFVVESVLVEHVHDISFGLLGISILDDGG